MDVAKLTPKKLALIIGGGAFAYQALSLLGSITNSTSSTAALGYIFLPVFSFIFALPFVLAGFCLGKFLQAEDRCAPKPLLFLFIPCLVFGYFIFDAMNSSVLVSQVEAVRGVNAENLGKVMDTNPDNKWILAAVTQNQNVTGEMLHKIAMTDNPALHKRMGHPNAVLMGANRKGLATMRLVALHPNVQAGTLVRLAESKDKYVLGTVAGASKTPVSVLITLYKNHKGHYLIEWGLASNPSTPKNILEELSHSDDEYTRRRLERNRNYP